MKRSILAATSIVLLLLAWLALDDITTGTESSHLLEWTIVALTGLWFAYLVWRRLRTTEAR